MSCANNCARHLSWCSRKLLNLMRQPGGAARPSPRRPESDWPKHLPDSTLQSQFTSCQTPQKGGVQRGGSPHGEQFPFQLAPISGPDRRSRSTPPGAQMLLPPNWNVSLPKKDWQYLKPSSKQVMRGNYDGSNVDLSERTNLRRHLGPVYLGSSLPWSKDWSVREETREA